MLVWDRSGPGRWLVLLALLVAPAAAPLAAQAPDSTLRDSLAFPLGPVGGGAFGDGLADRLPIDRVEEILRLQPGVSAPFGGDLTIRGAGVGQIATFVDGIPVTPGFRSAVSAAGAARPARIDIATPALSEGAVLTGVGPARFGNGTAGIVSLFTRSAGERWAGSASYERDGIVGDGFGLNRLEATLGGPLGAFRLFGALALDGLGSRQTGPGADTMPVFVDAGLDRMVTEFRIDDQTGDTTYYQREVRAFAVGRGSCEAFEDSRNDGIAENYGQECDALRTPGSSGSRYQGLAKLEHVSRNGGRVALTALLSQDQGRIFDYANLYNRENQWGRREASSVLGLSVARPIGRRTLFEGYLSRQRDVVEESPIDAAHVPGTGTLSFYLKPYDFVYDLESFPVDSELIANYRANSGRRAPIPPEDVQQNPSRYYPVDEVRNNAYGVVGFTESGGPTGVLSLFEETRTLGGASLTLRPRPDTRLQIGAEATRYELTRYMHGITSQAFSDAYIEKPVHSALFAEQVVRRGRLTVATGLRYDRFASGAERAYTIMANGDTVRSVRISSHPDQEGNRLVFLEDERRSALSPSVRIGYAAGPRTELRASYGQRAQLPDFGALFAGINTDLSITDTRSPFSSDLDLVRTKTGELGLRQRMGRGTTLDLAGFVRETKGLPLARLESLFDPQRGTMADIRSYVSVDPGSIKGLEAQLEQQFGTLGFARIAYAWLDGADAELGRTTLQVARPHNLAATLGLTVGGRDRATDGLFATFRYASGTPYTLCPEEGNESVISGGVCARGGFAGGLNTARTPSFKQLDLRLTRTFGVGGRGLTLFVDLRNALDWENVRSLFVQTRDVVNPDEFDIEFATDSSQFAVQAQANGVYDESTSRIDLRFGGAGVEGCDGFVQHSGNSAAADCVYLVRAEQRFGNGDGVFDLEEQRNASRAFYLAVRGPQEMVGPPRTIRLGAQLAF